LHASAVQPGADQRQEAPLRAADLPGAYELVERVYEDGKVLRQPEIAGLFKFMKGRGSLTLFLRNPDSTIGSASLLFHYTLNDEHIVRGSNIRPTITLVHWASPAPIHRFLRIAPRSQRTATRSRFRRRASEW
jgi:hypothetical protein